MRICILHSGDQVEGLISLSLLIGIKKKYPQSNITWIGDPSFFDVVRFNKRVNQCSNIKEGLDFGNINRVYGLDICINPSRKKKIREFCSSLNAKTTIGFTKTGSSSKQAEFLENVLSGNLTTNKHILDLYYSMADMKWEGEGYGLSYYPRSKQGKETGEFVEGKEQLPDGLLQKFDVINQYEKIITDDLFVTHAAIALRKDVTLITQLPYKIEFFSRGRTQSIALDPVAPVASI